MLAPSITTLPHARPLTPSRFYCSAPHDIKLNACERPALPADHRRGQPQVTSIPTTYRKYCYDGNFVLPASFVRAQGESQAYAAARVARARVSTLELDGSAHWCAAAKPEYETKHVALNSDPLDARRLFRAGAAGTDASARVGDVTRVALVRGAATRDQRRAALRAMARDGCSAQTTWTLPLPGCSLGAAGVSLGGLLETASLACSADGQQLIATLAPSSSANPASTLPCRKAATAVALAGDWIPIAAELGAARAAGDALRTEAEWAPLAARIRTAALASHGIPHVLRPFAWWWLARAPSFWGSARDARLHGEGGAVFRTFVDEAGQLGSSDRCKETPNDQPVENDFRRELAVFQKKKGGFNDQRAALRAANDAQMQEAKKRFDAITEAHFALSADEQAAQLGSYNEAADNFESRKIELIVQLKGEITALEKTTGLSDFQQEWAPRLVEEWKNAAFRHNPCKDFRQIFLDAVRSSNICALIRCTDVAASSPPQTAPAHDIHAYLQSRAPGVDKYYSATTAIADLAAVFRVDAELPYEFGPEYIQHDTFGLMFPLFVLPEEAAFAVRGYLRFEAQDAMQHIRVGYVDPQPLWDLSNNAFSPIRPPLPLTRAPPPLSFLGATRFVPTLLPSSRGVSRIASPCVTLCRKS